MHTVQTQARSIACWYYMLGLIRMVCTCEHACSTEAQAISERGRITEIENNTSSSVYKQKHSASTVTRWKTDENRSWKGSASQWKRRRRRLRRWRWRSQRHYSEMSLFWDAACEYASNWLVCMNNDVMSRSSKRSPTISAWSSRQEANTHAMYVQRS